MVFSGNPEVKITREVENGLREELEDKGVELESYYLDIFRNKSVDYRVSSGQDAVLKVTQSRPDVIVVVGDLAVQYFGTPLYMVDSLKMVFTNLSRLPDKLNLPNAKITAVINLPDIRRALSLLKQTSPGIDTVAVITDLSYASSGFVDYADKIVSYDGIHVKKAISTSSVDVWRYNITRLHADALILFQTGELFTADHTQVHPNEVPLWTKDVFFPRPVIGFDEDLVKLGLFMAVEENPNEQGRLAAAKVLRILQGRSPHTIPVEIARNSKVFVNRHLVDSMHLDLGPIEMDITKNY